MRAKPSPLHPADPWLPTNTQNQPLHQVWGQHYCGGAHQQQWWVKLSMWRRWRRLLSNSVEPPPSTPHWPSTVLLWREWAAPSSWVCTSLHLLGMHLLFFSLLLLQPMPVMHIRTSVRSKAVFTVSLSFSAYLSCLFFCHFLVFIVTQVLYHSYC